MEGRVEGVEGLKLVKRMEQSGVPHRHKTTVYCTTPRLISPSLTRIRVEVRLLCPYSNGTLRGPDVEDLALAILVSLRAGCLLYGRSKSNPVFTVSSQCKPPPAASSPHDSPTFMSRHRKVSGSASKV
jgi:hypothetical protein